MSAPHDPRPVTVARLDATVALARSLAQAQESEPSVLLADLLARRVELDAEIARVRAGRIAPLPAADAEDLRRLVVATVAGLLADLQGTGSRAVADALLSPARRDAVGAVLARVGLPDAHHAWLAAAEPPAAATAVAGETAPVAPEGLTGDGVDSDLEVGVVPELSGPAARPLTAVVRQALRRRREQPLAEALAEQPLEGGLAELVGWLTLADDAVEVVVDDATDDVTWTDPAGRDRTATVPRVRYRRAGTAPTTPQLRTTPTRENAR